MAGKFTGILTLVLLSAASVTSFSADEIGAEVHPVTRIDPLTGSPVEDEFKILFRSTNVSVVANDVFTCYAHDVRSLSQKSSYIVKVEPRPIPGHAYHMYISLCEEPGHRARDGGLEAWECGVLVPGSGRNPPLTAGQECKHDYPIPIGEFAFHYQAGPPDEDILSFAPGTGIPIGGPADPKYLVTAFHFFKQSETVNGMTGISGLDVTLKNETSAPMTPWYTFDMEAYGYLAPHAVGTTTGSWTLREDHAIRLHAFYCHWHIMALDVRVAIERREDGVREEIVDQDPNLFWGITNLPDSTILRPGDRLVISCTFNNTMDEVVRVKDLTMCAVIVTYSVEGNGHQLSTRYVFSFEKRYKKCFERTPAPGYELNFDGFDNYTGPVPEKECVNHVDAFLV